MKHTLSCLLESSNLLELLGNISWVPELNLLGALNSKSQIIWALRPGNIANISLARVNLKDKDISFHVIDEHSMVVTVINASYVSSTWRDAGAQDTSAILKELDSLDLLALNCIPNVDRWVFTNLTTDHLGAIFRNVETQDIISVAAVLITARGTLLGHFNL